MARLPTAPVAAGSLLAGFAVAQATGVRPLGGVVLAGAALWCAARWRSDRSTRLAAALLAVYLLAFAGSHLLTRMIGPWPSVLTVAALVGAITWALADRRPPRRLRAVLGRS